MMTAEKPLEITHRTRIPLKECDYEEYLMSGTRLLQFAADCSAELMIKREGQAGLLVNINGNIRASVYGLDMVEITTRLEKEGNRSRTVSFEIRKFIDRGFTDGQIRNEVLAEPVLCAEGTIVLVME